MADSSPDQPAAADDSASQSVPAPRPPAVDPAGELESGADRSKHASASSQTITAPGATSESGASYRGVRTKVTELAPPWQHVVVWLMGVLFASLTPLLLPYFHGIDNDKTPSMYHLLGHGDLLLIALVITIAGVTEPMLVMRNIPFGTILPVAMAILGGLLAIVAEAFWYADLAVQSLPGNKPLASHVLVVVTGGSLALFAVSALSSAACVYFAAGAR